MENIKSVTPKSISVVRLYSKEAIHLAQWHTNVVRSLTGIAIISAPIVLMGDNIRAVIAPNIIGAMRGTVNRLLSKNMLGNVPKVYRSMGIVLICATKLSAKELYIYLNGGKLNL